MKTPFYIGQTADEVIRVARKTRRARLAVECITEDGETFYFDLDAKTARQRKAKLAAMNAEVGDKRIDLDKLPVVRYFYDDCVLTFEKRGPYRVTKIEPKLEGDDEESTS